MFVKALLATVVAAAVVVPTIGKLSEDIKPINDSRFEVIEASFQEHLR